METINGCCRAGTDFIADVLHFTRTCNGVTRPSICRCDSRLRNQVSHAPCARLRDSFLDLAYLISSMTKLATHSSLKTRNLGTDLSFPRGLSLASFFPNCAVSRQDMYILALVFRNAHTAAMRDYTLAFSSCNGHKIALLLHYELDRSRYGTLCLGYQVVNKLSNMKHERSCEK